MNIAPNYQEGLKDGFIDAIIVTQPQDTGGHTYEKFLEVLHKYACAVYRNAGSPYYLGYASGFDSGDFYLKAQDRQIYHTWTDISILDSRFEDQICTNPYCNCDCYRSRLRDSQEWEYSKNDS